MSGSRQKHLTVKEIEKLTTVPPSCIKHRYQGGVSGFTLVHMPAGYTVYGLIYRVDGKRKKLTLGSTKRLTLGDARKLAGRFRSEIEARSDPHGERMKQRLEATKLRQADITKNHALAALDALVAQDKRAMADKVRQEGAAFFQWLIERDHVERNVFARIRKIRTAKVIRKRVLSDDEVGAIWRASEVEGHWSCWIKLLILTGGRNAEVRGACWSEFDLEARLWTIPAERYKNGYAHSVYLSDAMLAVLNAVTLVCDNLLPRSFTQISGAKALNPSHIPKMAFFRGFCGGR